MVNCIVKSNTYLDLYLCDTASYTGDLFRAKIFDEKEIPEYILNGNDEVILLNSEKGLELLVREIKSLDTLIPQEETRLEEMKKGLEALYNANPKMISKYIKQYNKKSHHLIGITAETESKIIKEIVEEK